MTSELGFEKNRQNCDLYKWKKDCSRKWHKHEEESRERIQVNVKPVKKKMVKTA